MPRGLISVEYSGLKEFVRELEGFVEAFPEVTIKALEARQRVIETKIRENWVSMTKGNTGDYVFSCIGQSTEYGKSNGDVVGTVGVYKIDKIDNQFGKTKEDLNAAQIAYWVNFGGSRLKGTRVRKDVVKNFTDEDLIPVNPIPFIDNAMYASIDEQEKAFIETFNRLMDQATYTGA